MGAPMTTDEIVKTIKHSSDLIILVEGIDDIRIYRWILESIGKEDCLVSTFGCNTLKDVFKRKNEFEDKNVVFITDRDILVYSDSIPSEYNGIVFTRGYSIENDLYQGKKFYDDFFDEKDKELFDKALDSFLLYYAKELDNLNENKIYNFREKPEKILDKKDFELKKELYPDSPQPTDESLNHLKEKYDLLVRGHSLFKLIAMVLHRKNRDSKYSEVNIYEMCYKCYKSECINDLKSRIEKAINNV